MKSKRSAAMAIQCLLALCTVPSVSHAQIPVYEVTPVESTVKSVSSLRSPSKVPSPNGPQA